MSTLQQFQIHPWAEKFPLIEGEEFDALVADIKRNGLREPIILNHDRTVLIDGRNRLRACEVALADPIFEMLPARYDEQMIVDLILSKNVHRRHMTTGQLAMIGLDYEAEFAIEAKTRQREAGGNKFSDQAKSLVADLRQAVSEPESPVRERKSSEQAGKKVGISGRAISQGKAIKRDAPDLAEKVANGQETLDAAYKEARRRAKTAPKPAPDPAPKPAPTTLILRTHKGDAVKYPEPKSKPTFNESKGEGISWAAWSWNPVTGCLHGCKYCYARELAEKDSYRSAYPVGFTPLFHHERLDAPANTTIPAAHRDDPAYRRVFVCSMADLYGRWVPDEWIEQVHASMLTSPQWEYLLLTKFPDRYVGLDLPPRSWVGTSVDEQRRVRIAERAFEQIDDVAVKWLSLEPLLQPLEFTDLSMFDWIVIGAQTGTRQPDGWIDGFAPPFEWVARIVAQAREAGCKVHLKPNLLGATSSQLPGMVLPNEYPTVAADISEKIETA